LDVELVLLNNAGNLIDTCYLAAVLALLNLKLPLVKVKMEE